MKRRLDRLRRFNQNNLHMNRLLASIRTVALTLTILLGYTAEAKTLSEEQMTEVYSYAYGAKAKLSKGDFRQVIKFELLQAEWNATLVPLVRGLNDPAVTPEQWDRMAQQRLNEALLIKTKMFMAGAQIEDSSAQSIIKRASEINGKIHLAWVDMRQAKADGDQAAFRSAGLRGQALAQEKAMVGGPVIRRLREKLGDDVVDKALDRELRELARKVGL
jgi:hypothetical protein